MKKAAEKRAEREKNKAIHISWIDKRNNINIKYDEYKCKNITMYINVGKPFKCMKIALDDNKIKP